MCVNSQPRQSTCSCSARLPASRATAMLDKHGFQVFVALALVLSLFAQPRFGRADEVLRPEQIKLFETHARPVLVAHCLKCHGPDKQKGKLRIDSLQALLAGGESGPAIVPGKPDQSLLIEAVRRESFEMPPDEELGNEAIEGLVAWIQAGAPWPGGPEYAIRPQPKITDEDRQWWCFQPIADPPVPPHDGQWVKNDIDPFILRQLSAQGLAPNSPADRLALMRRAYFDLTGLPPTPEEVAAFQADDSPTAYEALVDRLLESPRYGEHWARHWLDLVRYADSDGYRQDAFRPEAYRYREYVIRSFNDDKPYDRFVTEQLAGDEVDPGSRDAQIATMFLRHWIYEFNQRDVETQWQAILNDVTETTSDVLLGMGMGCARCHDHKFDPLLQKDYYRLQAFFAPLFPRDDQAVATLEERMAFNKQQQAWERQTADIRRKLFEIENPVLLKHAGGQGFDKFVDEIKAMMRKRDTEREPYEQQIATLAARQLEFDRKKLPEQLNDDQKARWEALQKQLAEFEALKPKPLATVAFVASDVGSAAPPTFIPDDPDKTPIEPGFLTILDPAPAEIIPPHESLQSTGRRTALARWITDPRNPLTARVIVNRIWQQHFGRGLVATTSDFGRLGEPPSHPELLDWLASRFVAEGWKLKSLHRLIMTSATYRQAATVPAGSKALTVDPKNRLLWRMNRKRLSAEQLRDSMLFVSGDLDASMGGASVDASKPRRSIYTKIMRNKLDDLLTSFDAPDSIRSTDERNQTTTSTQALLMINGAWPLARAKSWAGRLQKLSSSDRDVVATAFLAAYGRPATPAEIAEALAFLNGAGEGTSDPEQTVMSAAIPGRAGQAIDLDPASLSKSIIVDNSDVLPSGDFTIEAVIYLRSLYPDATVRTIVSQWNDNNKHPGWSLGVTSQKSRYEPRNLILQLVGDPQQGGAGYEVIASNLRPELNKPYYVAVSVKIGDTTETGVTFYMKDLFEEQAELQSAGVKHKVTDHYRSDVPVVLGGRHGSTRHYWDGLLDDVRISNKALTQDQLLISDPSSNAATVGFFQFEPSLGLLADSSPSQLAARMSTTQPTTRREQALVDFCHVLLNSNEFLYLD